MLPNIRPITNIQEQGSAHYNFFLFKLGKKKFFWGQLQVAVNGIVSDKPRRLLRHQHAQGQNSTLHRRQHSFMYWLCHKQNCLLCAY
jgi:hypothetical protein